MSKGLPLATQEKLNGLLNEAATCFTSDCKLTLIVRKPDNDNADVLMTIDTLDGIQSVLDRTREGANLERR